MHGRKRYTSFSLYERKMLIFQGNHMFLFKASWQRLNLQAYGNETIMTFCMALARSPLNTWGGKQGKVCLASPNYEDRGIIFERKCAIAGKIVFRETMIVF